MVKNIIRAIVTFSIDRPKTVISIVLILTAFFALQFPEIKIDTDPENMLEDNQPDRIFYRKVKKDFGIRKET